MFVGCNGNGRGQNVLIERRLYIVLCTSRLSVTRTWMTRTHRFTRITPPIISGWPTRHLMPFYRRCVMILYRQHNFLFSRYGFSGDTHTLQRGVCF